jgi:hypothetical protein
MSIDYEQLAQESAIFPWLDSDCMADTCNDSLFTDSDYFYDQEED